MTAIPDITLNNGQIIPQLGFGVFLVKPEDTLAAVSNALQAGYRHIDTAEMYGNEKEVGEAIGRSGLDRTDVFVTSKLSNDAHRPDDARRAFDDTLKALGFGLHRPVPGPLAAAHQVRRRLRLHLADPGGVLPRGRARSVARPPTSPSGTGGDQSRPRRVMPPGAGLRPSCRTSPDPTARAAPCS